MLLPHFPHKDLVLFILGNHSFVVWKFFIFLISQTCHLEKLDELFLYTSKYPYSSFFFPQRVTFNKLSDFPMVLSVCYLTFCAHLNFGKHVSIDLQCNIKMQSMRLLAKIAYFFCISGCTCSSCSFISPY